MTKAFFSYGRIDFEHPRMGDILRDALDQLEAEARASIGSRDFTIEKDLELLRFGDAWRHRLFDELAKCDLFIALVSPSWIKSPICQEELAAFREHERGKPPPPRILPIWFRDTGNPNLGLDAAQEESLAFLRTRQVAQWTTLTTSTQEERDRIYASAGAAIGARVLEIRAAGAADPVVSGPARDRTASPARTGPSRPVPAPADGLVTGAFIVPSQDPDRVSARLALHGLWQVTLESGRFVFRIQQASLDAHVTGARIRRLGERLSAGGYTTGIAQIYVSRYGTASMQVSMMATGDGLYAQPLAEEGEDDAFLFELARDDGSELTVEGHVTLTPASVTFESDGSDLPAPSEEAKARAKAIDALAQIVLDVCGGGRVPLEPASSPSSDHDA